MAKTRELQNKIDDFLENNGELAKRILAHGSPEAQGKMLALYANASTPERIPAVIDQLEAIKAEREESP